MERVVRPLTSVGHELIRRIIVVESDPFTNSLSPAISKVALILVILFSSVNPYFMANALWLPVHVLTYVEIEFILILKRSMAS